MATTKFAQISDNEIKFKFKDHTFLLVEQKRGVYSMGKAVQLYQLDGLKKEHVKELAWTLSDNHRGMEGSDAYHKGFITLDECKALALDYLKKLL